MTIYILMPVHNNIAMTRRFVGRLLAQTHTDYHLVLIDDGSDDGTADFVKRRVAKATVITGRGDWWWGGSLHQGYRWLRRNAKDAGALVLIINNDTEFEPEFLETAARIMKDKERTLLFARSHDLDGGKLLDPGIHVCWWPYSIGIVDSPEKINCFSTRGLFMKASDFVALGGFYPRVLPHYWSDYEFTIRAHRRGMSLITDDSLKLFFDDRNTGIRKFGEESPVEFVRKLFSRRSSLNPVDRAVFLALACPDWRYKIFNIILIWWMSLKMILFQALKYYGLSGGK